MSVEERNLTLMTDLYQLTMMYGYYRRRMGENRAVFDLYYRRAGEDTTYAVAAGLEQVVEYIRGLRFEEEDLQYLRSLGLFDEGFLSYLRGLRFTGDLYAVPEGTVVFPGEPIAQVAAPLIQAQFLETALLTIIGHQTLIATKASRVVQAAGGDRVLEFGLRRAQGPDAGIFGARAAMIGGCHATSNVLAGRKFSVPVQGTHAHSWVMSFAGEREAFQAYADVFPDNCLLLVDTYDTLKSGVPNAIEVFRGLRERGHKPGGIRLDSGDLAYLSRKARDMLDEAGFEDVQICASGDLDEEIIWDLKAQGARIDLWGVGTRMITSARTPALGCVYKLSAEEVEGAMQPRIKISENPAKVTDPGEKKLYRVYDSRSGRALADLVALKDERYDGDKPLRLFDPVNTWKQMIVTDYRLRDLLEPALLNGEQACRLPTVLEIRDYARRELDTLWPEYKRLNKPHYYKVDLSEPLWALKQSLLSKRK